MSAIKFGVCVSRRYAKLGAAWLSPPIYDEGGGGLFDAEFGVAGNVDAGG